MRVFFFFLVLFSFEVMFFFGCRRGTGGDSPRVSPIYILWFRSRNLVEFVVSAMAVDRASASARLCLRGLLCCLGLNILRCWD